MVRLREEYVLFNNVIHLSKKEKHDLGSDHVYKPAWGEGASIKLTSY